MKRTLAIFAMALLVMSVMPFVLAVDIGAGIDIDIEPTEFAPIVWMCDNRLVTDDPYEGGRISYSGDPLVERIENYAFEGEQIHWTVLVMDKNKIEDVKEVIATINSEQGVGGDWAAECHEFTGPSTIPAECNARLGQRSLTGDPLDPATQQFYECTFTVSNSENMPSGEYWLTVEAISSDGDGAMDENEYWYLNPTIALSVEGYLEFYEVESGTVSYSSTIRVGNDADEGSGVMVDMFISGEDFTSSYLEGERCPLTNHIKLSNNIRQNALLGPDKESNQAHKNTPCQVEQAVLPVGTLEQRDNMDHLCYYAVNGAYSTAGNPNADAEGYRPIVYSQSFTTDFYNDAEIIGMAPGYSPGNVLSPGAEMSITFKLGLPEPCDGNFDTGQIYFWGEAI